MKLRKLWFYCVLKNKFLLITFLNPLWYGMYCYTLCHRFPAYYPLLLRKDVLLFLFHPSSIQHHNTTVAKKLFCKKKYIAKKCINTFLPKKSAWFMHPWITHKTKQIPKGISNGVPIVSVTFVKVMTIKCRFLLACHINKWCDF